jgi:hypothetical protein
MMPDWVVPAATALSALAAWVALGLSIYNTVGKRWGGIKFTPRHWQSTYFMWQGQGQHVTPSRVAYENVSYQRLDPGEGLHRANYFAYAFTAELTNRMDVGDTLSGVEVAFLKNGAEVFRHSPFNEKEADDASGFLFEEHMRNVSDDLGADVKPPGEGVEPVDPITLPPRSTVTIKLRGYIGDPGGTVPGLHHLKGGCDEAQLRTTRQNGKSFNESITLLKTSPYQH